VTIDRAVPGQITYRYGLDVKRLTKERIRGAVEMIFMVGGVALVAGWCLAGADALYRWGSGDGADWLIVWTIVSGAWIGYFWYASERGKPRYR